MTIIELKSRALQKFNARPIRTTIYCPPHFLRAFPANPSYALRAFAHTFRNVRTAIERQADKDNGVGF